MPTSPPKNENPKTYMNPSPSENAVEHGGYEPPAAIPRPPLAQQERREVPPEAHPDLAKGGTGAKDAPSGRISG